MTVIATGLTSEMLSKKYCYDAILLYLRKGETTEAMIKKFGGNLDKTIIFLRERSYEGMEIVGRKPKPVVKKIIEPKVEPNILDPIYDPKDDDIMVTGKKSSANKKKSSIKSSDKPKDQKELF